MSPAVRRIDRAAWVAALFAVALLAVWVPLPGVPRGTATIAVALLAGAAGGARPLFAVPWAAALVTGAWWLAVRRTPALVVTLTLGRLAVLAVLALLVVEAAKMSARRGAPA